MVQQHKTRGAHSPSNDVSLKTWIRNAPWSQYFKDGCRLIVKSPFNFFVFFCCLSVVVWGAFLVLLMFGWVQLKDDATQKLWIEISSQVLNGFFTLANVPVHPKRFIGFVRGVRIWREDKAIHQQFLARFSAGDAGNQRPTPATGGSNQEENLLERLQFYRCFPGYGRERTETGTPMGQDSLVPPQFDSEADMRSRTLDRAETIVVVSRSRSRSKSRARTVDSRRSLSVDQSRVSSSDLVANPLHPIVGLDGKDSSAQTGSSSPSTATSVVPSEPLSPTIRLRVDIPEEELNELLTEETHRVVHSVVLPFLPFPLDMRSDDSSKDAATANDETGQDTTESMNRLEEGQGAMPLKSRVIQRGASFTALPRSSTLRRSSPRTRARTMTMSMVDDIPVSSDSPRRPTFVIHEDHVSSGSRSGSHAGHSVMSAQSSPDEKSSSKKAPPPPVPMPEALTQEQMDWVDEHEKRLLRRKERLQKSWPWYDYTIPTGIEPVDFFASPAEQLSSTTILLNSSPSTLVVSPARFLLIVGSFNLNSMIQEVLCGFMWGMNYHVRPGWVVGTGMAFGCLAAIVPSVLIMLHEQIMSRVRVVATAEEAIQDALDEKKFVSSPAL
ncbi:hypothetical protein EC957_003710 [Mortierella hygrophila]|uniref:Transmembrane protein n=1 Tax=Mortierella hygrophila TaxID=979708 RepID=A0A9P6K0S9_9FUNG|nr:hypothetical protein EC957_003710 [Mortierella hygrophila]